MRLNVPIAVVLTAAGFSLYAQAPSAKGSDSKSGEVNGLAVRPSPAEYQTAVKIGPYTLAVDFDAHGVPTSDGVFSNEEYITFEVAMFGPAGSHLPLKFEDFAVRINGKKQAEPSTPFTFIFKSLKSPEWEATLAYVPKESGNGINTGGRGSDPTPPPTPKMPLDVERKMELRVQKAAVPEADRPLPSTGLIFFQYSGKTKNIHSMDLIYNGAAGKATIPIQP